MLGAPASLFDASLPDTSLSDEALSHSEASSPGIRASEDVPRGGPSPTPLPGEALARLELPEDRPILTLAQAVDTLCAKPGIQHVVGAAGSAPALLARAAVARGARRVVVVTHDLEAAQRTLADLRHFAHGLGGPASLSTPLGGEREPLLAVAPEPGPYAEVHPDRRATMQRAAALFRLGAGIDHRLVVATAPTLMRRVVARSTLTAAGVRLEAETETDQAELVQRLSAAGYLRVPVVEDAGSFAVRGALLDVWPPFAERPVRVEFYGDLVLAMRPFDPDDQRTAGELAELWLPPAREAIVTPARIEQARQAMRTLCDAVNLPSTKARLLAEDVATGKAFFGVEGYLPAFGELVPVWEYFGPDAVVICEEGPRLVASMRAELERAQQGEAARQGFPHFPPAKLYLDEAALMRELACRPTVVTHRVGTAGPPQSGTIAELETVPVDAPTLAISDHADLEQATKQARLSQGRQGALEPLLRRLELWHEHGLQIVIAARTTGQAERLAALLGHRGVPVSLPGSAQKSDPEGDADPGDRESPIRLPDTPTPSPDEKRVRVVVGTLARGALALAEGWVLVTEEEIFGHRAHRKTARRTSTRSTLETLRALDPGDYVVHAEHGIGRYAGLERKLIHGVGMDLLVIEYQGGDKLFLPVYRMNQLEKYSGGEGAPRLDRLGGQSFAKTKAKVQRRVRQMADELLKLYAERAALCKAPLPPLDDDYATFAATFPFEETRDQEAAIADVMRDLGSERVADRLVCGDVGFGKTEVALRAAFRNVMAGRQVALLCPTTVLAQQHYYTFTHRLDGYPIVVHVLSRFQSKEEQQKTLRGLKAGGVDIVIGTHRLLSKDVHFRQLGLLVVDEEQRFGVVHKERIKQLRASVDALTLSATPIPRTLQLAIGGLRDLSLISTPPVDRRAIRTITSSFDEALVREAILRELGRGGQVFYVHNRVQGICERAARVQALLPEARLAVTHGQMRESTLEKTMLDFVAGEYDVLVTTAIIESGLDIPRANTILIDRADLYGLAQLYQLRGRVGRSSERAYCYLLVPPPSQISDEARARIEALERHTELGSGFHIASLDLELRGAGELLGAEQSGFTAAVGFELFCQMLEEATRELRGEVVEADIEPELSFDVEALIPEDYMAEVGVRLGFYKRLASAHDEAETAEIGAEMEDRFGPAPVEVRRLVELMRLKTELRRLRVLGMEATRSAVILHLGDDTPLDAAKVGALVAKKKSPYRLSPDGRLTRRLGEAESAENGLILLDRMLEELASCLKAGAN
jgi:transcription-repair coupling factor (superfamily II helicase)